MNDKNFKILIPNGAKIILNKLHDNGYEAYIVGGCVRDSIMGNVPNDWDICTSANPDEVIEVLGSYEIIPTGLKHGTVTALDSNGIVSKYVGYEITTFRKDGEYKDNRHPESVTFTNSLFDDLSRRDFTINAMAYNDEEGLIDPFDGLSDIRNKVIRCVGKASDRFEEDALRIMRAIRFSVRFGFKIDLIQTYPALLRKIELLKNISIERIREEFVKTIDYGYNEVITLCLKEVGVLPDFFTDKKCLYEPHSVAVKLAVISIYSQTYGNDIVEWMRKLKFSNYEIKTVSNILKAVEFAKKSDANSVRIAREIYRICGDSQEQFGNVIMVLETTHRTIIADELKNLYDEVHSCHNLSMLAVNGDDIAALGFSGKKIGRILNYLLEEVMNDEIENDKDALIDYVKNKMNYNKLYVCLHDYYTLIDRYDFETNLDKNTMEE